MATYYRQYHHFGGIDTEENKEKNRFASLKNMWRDYRGSDSQAVETMPGYRLCHRFSGEIHGIFSHALSNADYLVVHAGKNLYRFPTEKRNQSQYLASLEPIYTGVDERESKVFSIKETLYFMDGYHIIAIDKEGVAQPITPYIPTTYIDGEKNEERNLLTNNMLLSYTLHNPFVYQMTNDKMQFVIISDEKEERTCELVAYTGSEASVVIPQKVFISPYYYKVVSIGKGVFHNNKTLFSVAFPEGLLCIKENAFRNCTSIEYIMLPQSLLCIYDTAFSGCTSMVYAFFGKSLAYIGYFAFQHARLLDIGYAKSLEEYDAIVKTDSRIDKEAVVKPFAELPPNATSALRFKLPYPFTSVDVLLDGEAISEQTQEVFGCTLSSAFERNDKRQITAVYITTSNIYYLAGRKLLLSGSACTLPFHTHAVFGCRFAQNYDGRIFYAGNPRFPNSVFYTEQQKTGEINPAYVGECNTFTDGVSAGKIHALLPVSGMLAVLREENANEACLYYHTPERDKETGRTTYPATEGPSGFAVVGEGLTFLDDPVFLTKDGLYGITKAGLNLERSIACRSKPIENLLANENLKEARLAVFDGYLLLLCHGHIYMADGRKREKTGDTIHYTWYMLDDIGSYLNDVKAYRYATHLPRTGSHALSLTLKENAQNTYANGVVYSAEDEEGNAFYYTNEEDGNHPVDHNTEYIGGIFSPATQLCVAGDLLFFGTKDGALSVFNTDKRGKQVYHAIKDDRSILVDERTHVLAKAVNPAFYSSDEVLFYPTIQGESIAVVFDGETYTACSPLESDIKATDIAQVYYTHAFHAYACGVSTLPDDCDAPARLKDSKPRSLIFRMKGFRGSMIDFFVQTDRTPFKKIAVRSIGGGDFSAFAFDAMDFQSADVLYVSLAERERNWCEKQFMLYTDNYMQPFGLYGYGFAYTYSHPKRSE